MQVAMPLDVGIGIGAEDSVRLLLEITEGMDFEGITDFLTEVVLTENPEHRPTTTTPTRCTWRSTTSSAGVQRSEPFG